MSKEDLRDLLYEKASKEQQAYYDELKQMTPEQIMYRALTLSPIMPLINWPKA